MADRRELGASHAYMHNKSKKLYVVVLGLIARAGHWLKLYLLSLYRLQCMHTNPPPPPVTSGVILPSWNISTTLISSKAPW